MVTKNQIEKTVARCIGRIIDYADEHSDHADEIVAMCEEFSQTKFGVSLAELLRPTRPLIYQDISCASNEPDFPESKAFDGVWEHD
jgi:hypothetical protein